MRRGEEKLRSGDNWLTGDAWAAQWQNFKRSAWRLETLPAYKVGPEEGGLERFLATGEAEPPTHWYEELREHAAAGRTVGRVHTLTPPLSDYLRWEFTAYPGSVDAGEDVRILDYSRTPNPGLPDQDFWLFDDEVVVLMHYEADGTQVGRERLVDVDPAPYVRYKELAIQHSVPFLEYVAKD
ncbi:DUF6879 family protein [Amycolatopsis sp. NPDC059027]|uniref:DUF6879 family protein n=1 Tax=unclassified Amycolatopsis TaxID=2618356 RepID=UPI00366AD123